MRKCSFAVALVVIACLAFALAGPAAAGLIGGTFNISGGGMWWANVGYDSVDQKYLVIWSDYNVGGIVFGRFVSNGGAVIGNPFQIADGSSFALYPDIAYNSTNNEFLVTWDGASGIGAQRVRGSDGALLGGNFTAVPIPGLGRSSVAWSATSNTYLVVAYYAAGVVDTYGRLLSNTGAYLTGDINITNDVYYSGYPSVAWASSGNQFLVTWDFDGYIDGQRINATNGAFVGGRIPVSRLISDRSTIAYDSVNSRWLVQFNYNQAGFSYDQYGQLVNTDGTLYGGPLPLAHSTAFEGDTLLHCALSFAPGYGGRFFSSFIYGDYGMGGQELYATGAAIGPELILSYGVGGACNSAADTVLNRFLTVWNWQAGGCPIQGQLYEVTASAPPGPVTNFVATPGIAQNVLSWHNPSEPTFTGTMIRFKTNGFPTSPTDGTLVIDKANSPNTNDSHTHTGLTNDITYFYTAFAHSSSAYAGGANASATPSAVPGFMIIPQPQQWTWRGGTGFLVNSTTKIMANSAPDLKEQNAAQQLQRKVWDMTGFLPAITYGGSTTSNVIAIGDPARCPAVNTIIATFSEASGKAAKTEGYMLGVKDTAIVIRGFDNAGTFYGCQTLIQTLEYYKTTRIAQIFCYDYPELPYRGVYMRVKWEHDWEFTKEMLSEMIARYKCNYFSPEIHMASVSHPEIPPPSDTPVTLPNAQSMLNFTALHYMNNVVTWYPGPPQGTPMPEECIFDATRLARLSDLANDVKVYLNPPYVHVHESELSVLGCAAERAVYSNEYLFNQTLWQDWDRNYTQRGMWPFMWADMLRPDMAGGTMGTANVVATMPDMIIADWQYGSPGSVPTDYPTLDRWITYGRKAVGTPFGLGSFPAYNQYYGDKENIYYWANAVFNRRAAHPNNMLGILAWNKYMANNREVVVGATTDNLWQQQCLGCYPYYAEWSWNPNGRYWNPYPYGNGWSAVIKELAPARVSGLSAVKNGNNVNLTWTNPSDSNFTAAYVVYRGDRSPTSPIDGTYLADVAGSPGAAGAYTHVNAPADGAYYGVFSHDNVRHFSPTAGVHVGAAGYCFNEPFSYSNGALNGQGGWSGTATASHMALESQCVKILGGAGSYDAVKTVNCGDPGTGYIIVTCRINGEVGTQTMWNLWIDDSSAKNFARWYGSGTTARGRIGTTGTVTATKTLTGAWDTLKVKIIPSANTTEFFFNGVSLGVYSHSPTGVGDVIARLRFERIDNSSASGHLLYFDDLNIGEPPVGDTTPPGPVTNFTATAGDGQVSLSWTNPGDADFEGTKILFKTDDYPTNAFDGTEIHSGGGTSMAHTGLTNGTPYYYAAFAYDEVPNYSTRATASAIPMAGFCFRDLFTYAYGALNGQGGWSGSAGASQVETVSEFVRIWGGAGSYDSIHTMTCSDAGYGYIMVRILAYAGVGSNTSWSVWVDDASGLNFGRWYGSGTTARGRIGGTANVTTVQNLQGGGVWDSLVIKIVPSANTTQFFFNGADLGVFSHADQGTGDVVGRVRFERVNNSGASGEFVYLDDLRIGGS